MRILVADDDLLTRKMVQRLLEGAGHEVVLAADGAEAWAIIEKDHFPMVISDWIMPNVDGVELVRRIRARQNVFYTYAILLTAKSSKEELVEAMDAGADDFVSKPFDAAELQSRVRAGQRVVELEQSLAQRNRELQAAHREVALANERMSQDLEAAAKVQRALLPRKTPDDATAGFAWFYRPCDELAGDILNVFRLDERHVGLYVLDVSGHGVSSALLSVSVHHMMSPAIDHGLLKRRQSEPPGFALCSPVEVASQLNTLFQVREELPQYFTLLYGIVNLETRRFEYVQAGHPSPIHVPRNGAPAVIEGRGLPIGFFEGADYDTRFLDLSAGDRLYLYSDGLYEAMNAQSEQFGQDRILAALEQARSQPLEESLKFVTESFDKWIGSSHASDDISILALEMKA